MTLNFRKLTLAAAVIAATAGAANAQTSKVKPGETFSFDIVGYNATSGAATLLTPDETSTFGTPTTYTGAGFNGQDISITSSESIVGLNTTDTITVSTPTNFITTTTANGITITGLEFDLGNANSGSNTLDVTVPIGSFSSSGSTAYSGGTLALTPSTTLTNGNTSIAAAEGVQSGTTAITGFTVHSFTYSITYTAAPEPSSFAFAGAGLSALGMMVIRRRKVA